LHAVLDKPNKITELFVVGWARGNSGGQGGSHVGLRRFATSFGNTPAPRWFHPRLRSLGRDWL